MRRWIVAGVVVLIAVWWVSAAPRADIRIADSVSIRSGDGGSDCRRRSLGGVRHGAGALSIQSAAFRRRRVRGRGKDRAGHRHGRTDLDHRSRHARGAALRRSALDGLRHTRSARRPEPRVLLFLSLVRRAAARPESGTLSPRARRSVHSADRHSMCPQPTWQTSGRWSTQTTIRRRRSCGARGAEARAARSSSATTSRSARTAAASTSRNRSTTPTHPSTMRWTKPSPSLRTAGCGATTSTRARPV